MPWEPSQRPRKPRIRTSHRFIAPPEKRAFWFREPALTLSAAETATLADQVPGSLPRALLEYFINAAAMNFGWDRHKHEVPRPLVRYQLRILAHLIWKSRQDTADRRRVVRELFDAVADLDVVTKELLLEGIRGSTYDQLSPEYYLYSANGMHFAAVFEGALIADSSLDGRGDYRDAALHNAAAFLIWIYDTWNDRIPSLAMKETGPTTHQGTRRSVAGSSFAAFVFAFFERVDPELSKTRITSALRLRVAEIRKRKKSGCRDYHDMVNLLQ